LRNTVNDKDFAWLWVRIKRNASILSEFETGKTFKRSPKISQMTALPRKGMVKR
jgi:hypothetical protein